MALALALAASYCTDSTGPVSAPLSLRLSSAGPNDRAILFLVSGIDATARIDTVYAVAGSSYRVFAQRQSPVLWRVIVVGSLADGALVTISVPDASRTAAYSATVLDVADAAFEDVALGSRALTVIP